MPGRLPEIIAHRGTPREHPENSLPGFLRAVEYGVDGIELDVHVTRDGVPVVHHDAALRPLGTPLDGECIADLTLAELAGYELAHGVGVPTLAEAIALAAGRTRVYVEVKARDAADVVVPGLRGHGEATPVHSFDHRVSRRTHELDPSLPVGVLSVSYLVDNVTQMRAAGARDLWQMWAMIDRPLVEEVHAAGGRVIAWTVNDPAAAVALARLGVDGLCTDVPDVVGPAVARALGAA
jgi:glycerophosphoryl diester phosphodiesterase